MMQNSFMQKSVVSSSLCPFNNPFYIATKPITQRQGNLDIVGSLEKKVMYGHDNLLVIFIKNDNSTECIINIRSTRQNLPELLRTRITLFGSML